jgi:hypothetical protein
MSQVVGKVGVLTTDAKGNYKLKVDDKWYSTGSSEDPGITQGQTVQFDFELSKPWIKPGTTTPVYFNNITKGTLKPVTASQPPITAPVAQQRPPFAEDRSARTSSAPMSKDDYWRNKEERDLANEGKRDITQQQIQLQAARNAAIELTKVLAGEKAITYSEAASKQKPKDRFEVIKAMVDKLTEEFLAETQQVGLSASDAMVADLESQNGLEDQTGEL